MVIFYNVRDPSMRPWHRPSMYTNTPEHQATRIYDPPHHDWRSSRSVGRLNRT